MDTGIAIDVRNLFSVRVSRFDVVPATPPYVDVTFELQADKTRETMSVSVAYGKFPAAECDGCGSMSATGPDGHLLGAESIQRSAWKVVMNTTDANRSGEGGSHADVTWEAIKAWAVLETSKPSLSQTMNTL